MRAAGLFYARGDPDRGITAQLMIMADLNDNTMPAAERINLQMHH
jgi:hypothetical protein